MEALARFRQHGGDGAVAGGAQQQAAAALGLQALLLQLGDVARDLALNDLLAQRQLARLCLAVLQVATQAFALPLQSLGLGLQGQQLLAPGL